MSQRRVSLPDRRHARRIHALLGEMVGAGAVGAAVALVGDRRAIRLGARAGRTRIEGGRAVADEDLFDLASLTKPFTATLALVLDAAGLLPLDLPIGEIWPGAVRALGRRSLSDLLRQRAGFRPWAPLYRRCRSRATAERLLLGGELLGARPGTYSDLGFMLWGFGAERLLRRSLEELLREHLLRPLRLTSAGPNPRRGAPVVECRLDNAREVALALAAEQGIRVALRPGPEPGEVQDGNARFLGGLAGHAGLFAAAAQLWRLGSEWLHPRAVLSADQVRQGLAGSSPFALGWARRGQLGAAGSELEPVAVGHHGFTGGGLWLEPGRGRVLVLLAHRTSVQTDMGSWYRRFLRAAATAWRSTS